jgi:hypothetical protein
MKIVIISYLYAVFFILAFLVDRLPFLSIINAISQLSKSSVKTIRSDIIEDSEKQQILLANSFGLFKQSLKMTGLILLVSACGFLLLLLSGVFRHLNYRILFDYMMTTFGLLLAIISFFSYFLLKRLHVQVRL